MHPESPSTADFQRRQRQFADHIRHPDRHPAPPDVEPRRMAIYNELFFGNLEGFLAGSYPVLRRITPDDRWQTLVRDFFTEHACHSPLFTRLAEEFLDYLEQERTPTEQDFPFLLELAHYEWVELALTLSEADQELPPLDPNGDLLAGHPLISPLAWHLSYRYPVHRIGPDHLPTEPPAAPTLLVVYRDRQDKIGFLEINPVTHALLETLDKDPGISGRKALETIAAALNHPDPASVLQAGTRLLHDLRRREILLGTSVQPS
jgi:hypothetical protein